MGLLVRTSPAWGRAALRESGHNGQRPSRLPKQGTFAEGANLQEALAKAISDNLPSRECYSSFDLEKVR